MVLPAPPPWPLEVGMQKRQASMKPIAMVQGIPDRLQHLDAQGMSMIIASFHHRVSILAIPCY